LDKAAAIAALLSDEPKVRTEAVRVLGALGDKTTLAPLENALKAERVSFLKRLIPASIERIKLASGSAAQDKKQILQDSIDLNDGDYQKAVQFVSGVLLHEVSSKVGLLKYSVQKEIPEFEKSETFHTLQRLDAVMAGIASLRAASVSKADENFAINSLLRRLVEEVVVDRDVVVHFDGLASLEMQGDTELISLAFTNGLKNAYEAVLLSKSKDPIIVFWGQTDIENYVTLLDAGNGISGPRDAAFEIGKTNKKGHSGFGLAIARMAMTTLLGTVDLFPARLGGMRFEMRWPKNG